MFNDIYNTCARPLNTVKHGVKSDVCFEICDMIELYIFNYGFVLVSRVEQIRSRPSFLGTPSAHHCFLPSARMMKMQAPKRYTSAAMMKTVSHSLLVPCNQEWRLSRKIASVYASVQAGNKICMQGVMSSK